MTSFRLTAALSALSAVMLCTASACTTQPNTAESKSELQSRVQLSERLLEITDDASSVTADTVARALLQHDSAIHIAALERSRSAVMATVRSMALTPNPEEGIVRLYVWSRLAKWACEHRVAAAPDLVVDTCEEVYGSLSIRIQAVAETVIDETTRAHLDAVVERYKLAHPGLLTVGLMRIDDVNNSADSAILQEAQPTMMSPVTDAARQLEHTRLLGNQLVWLISRMPSALSEQADGTARMLLESERIQQALTELHGISANANATATGLEAVAHAQTLLASKLDALEKVAAQTQAASATFLRNALIGIAMIALGTVLACVAGAMFVIRRTQQQPQGGTP